MKQAREARLYLKGIRVNLEKERKALKKESLAKGQAIDLIAGTLRTLIEPIEEDLELKEQYDELRLAERKQLLWEKRAQELAIYNLEQYPFDLREATEEDYQKLREGLETARLTQIEKDAELERLRLEEVARLAEITRKKELAATRSKEMLQKGFQHEGVDLGEMNDIDYALLLTTKQDEADEKKMLQDLRNLGEQSVQVMAYNISIATLETIDAVKQSLEMFKLGREEKLVDFYKEKADYLERLISEKTKSLLRDKESFRILDIKAEVRTIWSDISRGFQSATLETLSFPADLAATPDKFKDVDAYYQQAMGACRTIFDQKRNQLGNVARLEKEKAALVVENVELQTQAPKIIVELKPEPIVILAGPEAISKIEAEIESVAKKTFKHPVPTGPTADQLNSDKVKLLAIAGMIAGIKMPEVETMAAKNILVGTTQLIEKIRIYLVEKSKTLK